MTPAVGTALRRAGYDPARACVMVPPSDDPVAPPLIVLVGYPNDDASERWTVWSRVTGRYVLTQAFGRDYTTPIRLLARAAGSC